MLDRKLLLRRRACVPWLLAVGLVLGWSGEVLADNVGDGNNHYHGRHVHVTDPKMVLTFEKGATANPYANKINVSWSKSRTKGLASGNGEDADTYFLTLFSGEIPPYSAIPAYSTNPIFSRVEVTANDPAFAHTFTGTSDGTEDDIGSEDIFYNGQLYDTDGTPTAADGKYWVRIEVGITGGPNSFFAKQIVLEPDYELTVHPTSVREDDGPVTLTLRVTVGSDDQVDKNNDTNVFIDLARYAERLSARFSIDHPTTLTIPKGEKEAVAQIIFTPVANEDDEDGDLPITLEGFVTGKSVEFADIIIIDDDKPSRFINLSFSPDEVSKDGPSVDIEVTATLDGKELDEDIRFNLNIDDAYETVEEGGTRTFREGVALRETDYKAHMSSITIREGKVSGKATITIIPLNEDDGVIGVIVKRPPQLEGDDERMITVNRAFIRLSDQPAEDVIGLKATPFAIREDAGVKEVTLEVSLRNPVSKDERVRFNYENGVSNVKPADLDPAFDNAEIGVRDTHWDASVPEALFIPRGETKGTTTMIVEILENDDERNDPRAFTVIATVGNDPHRAGILITDDDTTSKLISLEVSPDTISEDAGETEITVTGTLDGKEFDDEVVVFLSIARIPGDNEMATRDIDYDDDLSPLRIPANSITGTTTITITPHTNDGKEEDERIRLISLDSHPPEARDEDGDVAELDVKYAEIILKDSSDEEPSQPEPLDPAVPSFAAGVAIANQEYTVGTAIDPLVLPEATGGDAPITYNVLGLPAGLEFDPATRTLSGTPTAVTDGPVKIFYAVSDVDNQANVLPFSITVNAADEEPSQPEPLDPAIPSFAAGVAIANQEYTVGTAIDPLVLPEAIGGDAPITYVALGLPAGLEFDPATRTLSGTPTAVTDGPVKIFYTVSDVDNQANVLPFSITVNAAETEVPPSVADGQLTATPSSIREDAETTQVLLTVSLMEAKGTDERITFRILPASEITEGKPAVRDADYDATLMAVGTIPAGATVGMTTLSLTPMDNSRVDGMRVIGVEARFASGETLRTDIKIADDETLSTSITLSADPNTINEKSGETTITVTATLDGRELAEDAVVLVSIDAASTASRDRDYDAELDPLIRIPAGSIMGSTQLVIEPREDEIVEGNETITLTGLIAGLTGDEVEITLTDQAATTEGPRDDAALAFAADARVADQTYAAGTAIDPLVLPTASGGTGTLTYSVLTVLPAGLSFDSATRTLSGTPSAATEGAVVVIYTVTDEADDVDLLTFSITVNVGTSVGTSTSFGFAADTAIPDQRYTAGTAITPLVLPAASGGTGALTYRLVGLPAGLSFDGATRTLSGTPTTATGGAVEVSYIVTDEGGEAAFLTFNITVNPGLSFGNLGFGKIVPTASHDLAKIREFVVGQHVEDFSLPEASGGTAPLTYTLSPALPAGLTFDAATRTIAGTPRAEGETAYTYTVTDANGASTSLSLQTLPTAFSLADNFPNPFNPATTIQYALPQAADVELTVYNVLGQPVRTLVAEHQSAGRYAVEWDATNESGHSLSAGMYFYRLQAGGEFHEVKKMLLLK